MRNLSHVTLGCLLMLLSFSINAQSVAKVLVTNGKVTATHGNRVRVLSRGADLSVGEVVQTQSGADVRFRYNNGSLVTLNNNASYKILKFSPQQDVEIEAELNRGQARIVTEGNLRKKEILKTKVVAMAIIGTDVTANTGAGTTLQVNLSEGQVNIDGTVLSPGVYTVSIGTNGTIRIVTPEGQVITSQQQGVADLFMSENSGNLGELVTTVIASEAATPALPDMSVATLEIVCP